MAVLWITICHDACHIITARDDKTAKMKFSKLKQNTFGVLHDPIKFDFAHEENAISAAARAEQLLQKYRAKGRGRWFIADLDIVECAVMQAIDQVNALASSTEKII